MKHLCLTQNELCVYFYNCIIEYTRTECKDKVYVVLVDIEYLDSIIQD